MTVKGRTYPTTPTNTNSGNTGGANLQFGTSAISAVVVAAVASGIASLIYLMVMRRYPKQLIKVTFWISFVYFLLVGIAAIVLVRNIVLGVIFLVFAVFYALAYRWYKTRIPFAAVVLSTVTGVTQKYPGTVWVAVCGLLVNLAFSAWWIVTVVACTLVYGETTTRTASGGQKVSPLMYPVWVFLMFSMYWTSQVIQNTVHVTISGVFASYYFMAGSQQGMPSNPTMGALKRATTTSFGSICYGSLLIAIIRTLKAIMKQAQQNTDSAAAQFVACCLQCLLGCVEGLLEFFNHYAFVQCAIYGKDYCRAAKDTWTLIKDRGIDLIINDSMVDRVLGYGALLVAGVSTLIAWGVYAAGNAAAGTVSTAGVDVTMIIVLIAAAAIGFVIMSLVGTVIDSGVASTFVCLAEDPAALKATKPELWEKIRETYPSAAFISMYA
ncbi:plasma-membrane choline transporter-domain-containing protein [Blastocladiella britannica]|nr:plasma-membrane choline transporter-domain-containing protein [Blastocladiella britannica]